MNEECNQKKRLLARLRAFARETNKTFLPLAIQLVLLINSLLDMADRV